MVGWLVGCYCWGAESVFTQPALRLNSNQTRHTHPKSPVQCCTDTNQVEDLATSFPDLPDSMAAPPALASPGNDSHLSTSTPSGSPQLLQQGGKRASRSGGRAESASSEGLASDEQLPGEFAVVATAGCC